MKEVGEVKLVIGFVQLCSKTALLGMHSFWVTLHCVKGKKLSLSLDLDKSSLTPRIFAKRGIFTPSPTLQDG